MYNCDCKGNTPEEEHEVFREALRKFGNLNQAVVMLEEMSELQKELCKDLRGQTHYAAIAEEIADVEIMLEQMKLLFDNRSLVQIFRNMKVNRLRQRLKELSKNEDR